MENVVDNVIKNAFRNLIEMEQEDGNIKLIYPTLRDGKGKRHSEQEFKQLFIDNFCKAATNLKYSVETPTLHGYSFKKGEKPVIDDENGRSGNIDNGNACTLLSSRHTMYHSPTLRKIC